MKSWGRRIRAAIRMGLTWALAWFGAGMALLAIGLVVGVAADVPFPLLFGMFGFLAGTAFSGVLSLVDGRRRFDQMSLPRFAGWGALGGLLLTGAFVTVTALSGETQPLESVGILAPIFGMAGAGSAAGMLALARRAEARELLQAGDDVAEVGLSDEEARQLLGDQG